MSKLLVIGLCGKARSGKDTTANVLTSHYGFHRIALADGIRASLTDLDGPTWEFRKERDEAGQTDRQALQILGTECREDIGDATLWINLALAKIRFASRYHPRPRTRFVIPDIRFPHECVQLRSRIRSWDGEFTTWKIVRDAAGGIAESAHASEQHIRSIAANAQIINNGTIAELAQEVQGHADALFR